MSTTTTTTTTVAKTTTHLLASERKGRVEPLLERRDRLENRRKEKVEQRPKLGKLVLQRRPRQQ